MVIVFFWLGVVPLDAIVRPVITLMASKLMPPASRLHSILSVMAASACTASSPRSSPLVSDSLKLNVCAAGSTTAVPLGSGTSVIWRKPNGFVLLVNGMTQSPRGYSAAAVSRCKNS